MIAAFTVSFLYGCKCGWILANIQTFLSDSSPIQATHDDISWMTSISFTSSIFAVILCLKIGDRFSHRQILTCIDAFYVIVWTLILFTSSIRIIIICFFLYGIASGLQYIIMCAYIGEITDPQNREVLGLTIYLAGGIGTEVEYLLSYLNSYYLLALFPLLISIFGLFISHWMVDSPYYLVSQDESDVALKHLAYLNDKNEEEECLEELQDVREYVDEHRNIWSVKNNLAIMFMPANLKLLLILILVNGLSHMSGSTLVSMTGSFLLKDFTSSVDGDQFTNVFNLLRIGMDFCTFYTVKKFDRRTLFLVGYPAVGLLHLICGLCYYVESENGNSIDWLAQVIAFLLIIFAIVSSQTYHIALGILKLEIFPHKFKEFYSSLLLCTCDWFIFAVNRSYFSLEPVFGNAFLMTVFGIVHFATAAIIYFYINDTKNKTLLQIRTEINSEFCSSD
ncbi:hypothetical protein V9T40_011230 [Parthenolecanium corni]|uniref:Major facilitator superfamily (MFS) profile domain-containing protein n=1 Tax=Parthenolecanium corni TaxID=536013 RepID=A0AAN9T6G9_9HEMI